MAYPHIPNLNQLTNHLVEYSRLMHEYGSEHIESILLDAEEHLKKAVEKIKTLPLNADLERKEPNSLDAIKALRSQGPRKLWTGLNQNYQDKLEGAMLARFAGCTLGAVVEFWSIEAMENWAKYIGDAFPPQNYWTSVKSPNDLRYGRSPCIAYTRPVMDGVPVDDDVTYTLLGLLIAEDFGIDFTVEDVGKAWVKYLPYACTAEEVALDNLKAGIPALQAADINNPYVQWIGADIRSDPWGYMAPAYPEKAAELAWRDATISHRRNGIYGEMFFSAAISAAFAVDNAMDALKIGLTEIPAGCALYKDVIWALEAGKEIKNYKEARQAVEDRFVGMSGVHTNNNACLTIFGLMMGGNDVTRVISETVAMGLDNDCTAATAGSIVGAIVGKKGVPEHWYKPFNNKVFTYMNDAGEFKINDLVDRFTRLAEKIVK